MFHWICPECGREIAPSVRECQACDPTAVVPAVVEPSRLSTPALVPELLTAPIAVAPGPVREVSRLAPDIETRMVGLLPAAQTLDSPPRAEIVTEADASPFTVTPPLVAEQAQAGPVTILEASPPTPTPVSVIEPRLVEAAPAADPVGEIVAVAHALPAEPTPPPVAEPIPLAVAPIAEPIAEAVAAPETSPAATQLPVREQTLAEVTPVVAPIPEAAVDAYAPVAEQLLGEAAPIAEAVAAPETAPAATPVPVEEPTPVQEPRTAAAMAIAEAPPAASSAPEPPVREPEIQIKLQDVPDPLLVLAEEIRAAQVARAAAAAAAALPSSAGLLELVSAVGVQPAQASAPIEHAEHAASSLELPTRPKIDAPERTFATAEATSVVALLAPTEPVTAPLMAPEPVGLHELRPAALAPEPQPTTEPEPVALAEPQAQPRALAPDQSPDGPTLPLAPMQEYKPATPRSIHPVAPPAQILAADTAPRVTLPGPALPPGLVRLQGVGIVTVIGEQAAPAPAKEAVAPAKPGGAPGWLVSTLVMALLLTTGMGIVFYLLPHPAADAKPVPTPAVAATTPAPTGGSSPLGKFVEVTGFRIITSSIDPNKKSEVQYLIVNHSDADISDANIFVTLRSAKPGQPPLCRFSFKVPSLGPFESKEMSSPIEKSPRAVSLPDWQDVRAEVQISQ